MGKIGTFHLNQNICRVMCKDRLWAVLSDPVWRTSSLSKQIFLPIQVSFFLTKVKKNDHLFVFSSSLSLYYFVCFAVKNTVRDC